jgi:hypothetical protein
MKEKMRPVTPGHGKAVDSPVLCFNSINSAHHGCTGPTYYLQALLQCYPSRLLQRHVVKLNFSPCVQARHDQSSNLIGN